MKMTKDDDTDLNAVFAQMRAEPVVVREGLLDRIMMDADAVLADQSNPASVGKVTPRPRFGAMVLDAIGGWPSFGGLAAATVAGVWIGVSPPEALSGLSASILGTTIEVPLLENDAIFGLEG